MRKRPFCIQMKTQSKTITNYLIAAVVVICVVIFVRTFILATIFNPEDTGVVEYVPIEPLVASASVVISSSSMPKATTTVFVSKNDTNPDRLIIPSLNIDAHVQYVGVNSKGNIGTPSNFKDVAWYSAGVVPGEVGSAIIDGHLDNGLGMSGIFIYLSDIKIGDIVTVVAKNGARVDFVVASIQVYDYLNVSQQVLFGTDLATSSLKLITCGGAWVSGNKMYDKRLIVTANRVL